MSHRVRTNIAIGTFLTVFVASMTLTVWGKRFWLDDNWAQGVTVEAAGFLLDVLLFGIVMLQLDERRDQGAQLMRWQEELEDFRGWFNNEESARRTAGLVRRIARAGVPVSAWKANLRQAELAGLDLSGADLWGADLRDASLQGVDLNGADLRGADLDRALRSTDDAPIPGWRLMGVEVVADQAVGRLERDDNDSPGVGA